MDSTISLFLLLYYPHLVVISSNVSHQNFDRGFWEQTLVCSSSYLGRVIRVDMGKLCEIWAKSRRLLLVLS